MIRTYRYELWDGKKSVGDYVTTTEAMGKFFIIPTLSNEDGFIWETIKVPIAYRCISDNGVDYVIRRCLDVRRKSKRQIDLIIKNSC